MKRINWNIIAKHTFGEALSDEEKQLIAACETEEEMKLILNESSRAREEVDRYFSLGSYNTSKAWEKVSRKIQSDKKRRLPGSYLLRMAGIMLVLISTVFFVRYFVLLPANTTQHSTSIHDTHRPTLQLPDGSSVTMNYNTQIRYASSFNKKNRTIHLNGEAFFDVKPDAQKPFVIKTQNAKVLVLGTSFNVKAFDSGSSIDVTVETGNVELQNTLKQKNRATKIILKAGQMGIIDKHTGSIQKMETSEPNAMAWFTRDIEFHSTPLSEVLTTIEHVYGISFEVNNQVDMKQTITATFSHHEKNYVLDVIALTLSLNIKETHENTYLINTKK